MIGPLWAAVSAAEGEPGGRAGAAFTGCARSRGGGACVGAGVGALGGGSPALGEIAVGDRSGDFGRLGARPGAEVLDEVGGLRVERDRADLVDHEQRDE